MNRPFVFISKLHIKGDGKLAEEIKKMIIELSLKDTRCLSYSLFQNILEKTKYIVVEKWESKEKLDAYMKTEHFAKLGKYLKIVYIKPMELEVIEEKK